MEIRHISEQEFEQEVINSDKPVLVDFYATWCGPCQMLAPVLEAVAQQTDDFKIVKVDVDENQELAMNYRIISVPTLLKFENGKQTRRFEGFTTQDGVLEIMRG